MNSDRGASMLTKANAQNWKPLGDELAQLVQRVRRLCPDHRDPHRFHEEKSEIAHELSKLSRRLA